MTEVSKTILVTGGAGFIGSHFVLQTIRHHPDWRIINLDKLTYAGRQENLKEIENNSHYEFVKGDIGDKELVSQLMKRADYVVNFAAESHVDNSIQNALPFIQTDVVGAYVLLDEARKNDVERFVQISTDEVYGQIDVGLFTEKDILMPRNPYSASKAAADRIAYSFSETYGLPVMITRSSNNYGPKQYPEKLIPLFITNLLCGKKIPVYGTGKNIRDWIFVEDNCEGIDLVLLKGAPGEVYNIGGGNEKTNLDVTKGILNVLGNDESMIEYVTDRLGHDSRYALDSQKIMQNLGWRPKTPFSHGLKKTVEWYVDNRWWWEPLVGGQK